jgi:hypothetical protein
MEFSRCARAAPALNEKSAASDGLSKLNSVHVEVDVVLGELAGRTASRGHRRNERLPE